MDENIVATADTDVDEETTAMQEDAMDEATNTKEEKDPRYIAVTVDKQPALLGAIREAAAAQNLPLGTWCQKVLAEHLGITITTTERKRNKYATKDEAKRAQQAQTKTRYEALKLLKAKYAAELEAAIKDIAAKQAAEAAEQAAS